MASADPIDTTIAVALKRAHWPAVMTLQDIAECLGYGYDHVQQNIVTQPDFPARLSRFASPRYARADVLRWAGVEQ